MLDDGFVGELERAVESVCEQFTAEVIHEVSLPLLADVGFDALHSGALAATGKNRVGIHRTSGEVLGTRLAHWSVAFKRQTENVEPRMTGSAHGDRAMFGQHVAEWQVRLRFVGRQLRNNRRRWRDDFAEHAMNHPVSA